MNRKTRTHTTISVDTMITEAIQTLLAGQAEARKKMEAEGDTKDRWYAQQCYITSQDVERETRDMARRQLGTYNVRFNGLGTSLLNRCREVLLGMVQDGKLSMHNPEGCHSITRMRYRPVDVPLAEAEKRTEKKKEKEKPVHLRYAGRSAYSTRFGVCCTAVKSEKQLQARRNSFGGRHRHGSGTRSTDDADEVTCPRCRKLLDHDVTVVKPDPTGEGVDWKQPQGSCPEVVQEMPLRELVARASYSCEEGRLRGGFLSNSISMFILDTPKTKE
jgi:hypothetical protein